MFRSQSGPGLSINTASANSVTASSSQPPPAGILAKPLFGAPSSQPQASSSLFGTAQAGTSSTQQAGNNLFGNPSTTQQPSGSGKASGSSLFGLANAQQSQSQPKGSSFVPAFGQTQAQNPSNNLFGAGSGTDVKSSLFASTQHPGQSQQPSMGPPSQPSLFSATIGQQTQQQQTVPGVRISTNELRSTTRFNDLHEELQKAIEYVDNFVLNQIQFQEQCAAGNDGVRNLCLEMPADIEYCSKQLDAVQQALENDAESIAFARDLVKTDVADAKLSFEVIRNLKLPPQFHQSNLWSSTLLPQVPMSSVAGGLSDSASGRNIAQFFSKEADTMAATLDTYRKHIGEVEDYLHSVEANTLHHTRQLLSDQGPSSHEKSAESQVKELAAVLRAFESGILGVAAKVGHVRQNVQDAVIGFQDDETHNSNRRFGTA